MKPMVCISWFLLIHQIPPKPDYLRVKIGRRLQQVGAVAIKRTVYALPGGPRSRESFEWVLREITSAGGEGVICESTLVAGLTDTEIRGMFNAQRDADYERIVRSADAALTNRSDRSGVEEAPDARQGASLLHLQNSLARIRDIDFFEAPRRRAAEESITKLEARLVGSRSAEGSKERVREELGDLKNRIWVTRAGIEEDRIGTAWLIRRFIDATARFRFVAAGRHRPESAELRFDMYDAEFTHDGDRCTFEVLLDRLGLEDRALVAIAEVIHDIDLRDDKFVRPETPGVERLIRGVVAMEQQDEARLERGMPVFDALYAAFKREQPT